MLKSSPYTVAWAAPGEWLSHRERGFRSAGTTWPTFASLTSAPTLPFARHALFSGHEALCYLPNDSVTSLAKGCCPAWGLPLPRILLPKTSFLIISFSSLESLPIHSLSVVLPDHLILKLQASHPHSPPPYPDLHSIFPETSSPSNTQNVYFPCSLFISWSTHPPLPLHLLVFCLKYKREKRNIDHDCLYVLSMPWRTFE